MNESNTNMEQNDKKIHLITAVTVLIGAVTSVCLLFFFGRLFNSGSNDIPRILNAQQIGNTDSSALIAWSCSDDSAEFLVRYKAEDQTDFTEFRTAQPFAALHDLQVYTTYQVQIHPVKGNQTYEPVSLSCSTAPYCKVTAVNISEVTSDSAVIDWEYDGLDNGFSVIAYALDKNGKRHFTTEKSSVPVGAAKKCTIDGLLSNLTYTVCVMPETKYSTVGKSTFTTDKYSKKYKEINIIRFVVCPEDSANSLIVTPVSNLTRGDHFRTSMIINGNATAEDKADLVIYITDQDGNIISDEIQHDVPLNPDNRASYGYRILMSDFSAPTTPGNYIIYAALDNVTVSHTFFSVTQ